MSYAKFKEFYEHSKKMYGTVEHEGREIALTDDPTPTGCLLPAPYINHHEVEEGEPYDFSMSAHGIDSEGSEYIVVWTFLDEIRGEHDSYDHLNFDDNYEVERA